MQINYFLSIPISPAQLPLFSIEDQWSTTGIQIYFLSSIAGGTALLFQASTTRM